MAAYLGVLGNLVEFRCLASEQVSKNRPVTYHETIGGLVKAQYGATVRREWQADISPSTPAQVAGLQGMAQHLFGPPPWVWVSPWAQVTNMLTPAQSMPGGGNPGAWGGDANPVAATIPGLGRVHEALSPVAPQLTFPASSDDRIPVIPGQPLTVSVYGSGSGTGTVRALFYNEAGGSVGSSGTSHSLSGTMHRFAHSVQEVPAGAVSALISVSGFLVVALPSATWTTAVAEWTVGNGCSRSITDGLSEAVTHASRNVEFLRRSELSFTLREVG